MNQLFAPLKREYLVSHYFIKVFLFLFITACNGDDTKNDDTKSGEEPKTGVVQVSPKYHHLKIDKQKLIDNFFNLEPNLRKMVFNFKVNDMSQFPGSLTLAAWATKQADGNYINCTPTVLDILPEEISLPADVLYSTMEISKTKLANVVGNDGQAGGVPYDYVLFVPITVGCRNTLTYRISIFPKPTAGAVSEEDLNPCPPDKPN